MAKKIICLLAVISLLFACASCNKNAVGKDGGSVVLSTNGGFTVETNDYLYFINGVESYSTSYKSGKVTKASLMRTKKSNLSSLSTLQDKDYDTIVSKLIVSDDYNAGIFIYGDYVYYAVPSVEKNNKGEVKNSTLEFRRTKLDATGTSANITGSKYFSHTAEFRYIAVGDKVYLVVYDTSLYVYDAISRKQVYSYEKGLNSVLFDMDNAGDSLFYVINPINTNLYDENDEKATKASYSEVHRITLGSSVKDEIIMDCSGKYTIGEGGTPTGAGVALTGATVKLIRHKDGILYFSRTYLDSTNPSTAYLAISDDKLTVDDNKDWDSENYLMNYEDTFSASVYGDGALFVSKNEILYVDASRGLMKYDFADRESQYSVLGVSNVFHSENIAGATLAFIDGDYLYYYNGNNYYRLNYKDADKKEVRLNVLPLNTSWYKPEVVTVGDKTYFLAVYSDSQYKSYVYAIDVNKLESDLENAEDKDEFYTAKTDYEYVTSIHKTLLGVMSESDLEAYESYIKTLDGADED